MTSIPSNHLYDQLANLYDRQLTLQTASSGLHELIKIGREHNEELEWKCGAQKEENQDFKRYVNDLDKENEKLREMLSAKNKRITWLEESLKCEKWCASKRVETIRGLSRAVNELRSSCCSCVGAEGARAEHQNAVRPTSRGEQSDTEEDGYEADDDDESSTWSDFYHEEGEAVGRGFVLQPRSRAA